MQYTGFGLGCGSISVANEQAAKESKAIIQAALAQEITFLNTADFYGSGESELGIVEALTGYNREKVYISDKFGMLMSPKGNMYGLDVHPSRVKNYLAHSLKRLKTDYIDCISQQELSQVDAETLRCAKDVHPIASVEMEYSLFNRSMEQTILPTARELGIDVVAFSILAYGLLSGAWTKERVATGEMARNASYIEIFQKGHIEKNILLVEQLRVIAAEKNVSLAQLIYAWSLTKGKDIIPIISVSKLSQFNASILAREIVTHEEVEHIEQTVPVAAISGRSFPN